MLDSLLRGGFSVTLPPLWTLRAGSIGHRSHPSDAFDRFSSLDGHGGRRSSVRVDQLQLQRGRDWHAGASRGHSPPAGCHPAGRQTALLDDDVRRKSVWLCYAPNRSQCGNFRSRFAVLWPVLPESDRGGSFATTIADCMHPCTQQDLAREIAGVALHSWTKAVGTTTMLRLFEPSP